MEALTSVQNTVDMIPMGKRVSREVITRIVRTLSLNSNRLHASWNRKKTKRLLVWDPSISGINLACVICNTLQLPKKIIILQTRLFPCYLFAIGRWLPGMHNRLQTSLAPSLIVRRSFLELQKTIVSLGRGTTLDLNLD